MAKKHDSPACIEMLFSSSGGDEQDIDCRRGHDLGKFRIGEAALSDLNQHPVDGVLCTCRADMEHSRRPHCRRGQVEAVLYLEPG